MDRLEFYQDCIERLLSQYAENDRGSEDVDVELIFDRVHHRFLWMHVGWEGLKRVYNCFVHFDVKDGKIWLQQNLTELNPAEDLIEMGVERDCIVLGLHPPYKRPFTDYGVA